jgi:uroporphyrinogen III methyltransferase/synthase
MKVVVTRARESVGALAKRLRAEGLDVDECPLVRIEPIEGEPVRAGEYDWLVLTSARAVEQLFRRLDGELPKVAVVGPGTAAALRAHGVEPAVVASESTQEGLLRALPPRPGRVLFAGAEGARDLLPHHVGADVVALYRTLEEIPVTFPEADLVVLASASAARAFAAIGRDLPCVSIGPVTSAEARRLGLRVVAEAATHDLDGLVAAVVRAAGERRE